MRGRKLSRAALSGQVACVLRSADLQANAQAKVRFRPIAVNPRRAIGRPLSIKKRSSIDHPRQKRGRTLAA